MSRYKSGGISKIITQREILNETQKDIPSEKENLSIKLSKNQLLNHPNGAMSQVNFESNDYTKKNSIDTTDLLQQNSM
jgi:hypothetical protein